MNHTDRARKLMDKIRASINAADGAEDQVAIIAQALREAEARGAEANAMICLRTVWDEGVRFSAGYKNGWIDATEECAKRIRAAAEKERGK